MARISSSGGIYIEILGDYTEFEKDLRVARQTAIAHIAFARE